MATIQKQVFTLGDKEIPYTLRKGWRARSLRISIKQNGSLTVSAPSWASKTAIIQFIESQKVWIQSVFAKLGPVAITKEDHAVERDYYTRHREKARKIITERVEYYAKHYEAEYKGIAIRNQSTRWGSCSSNKRLNFNYRIAFLSEDLLDYVVVHEICHLFEMNHSAEFWAQVARAVPDHRERRRVLKQHKASAPVLL